MANTLPLFPLNIVVFPGEKLNLHIFEPRYKQLIHDCKEQGLTFGMPSFVNNAVTAYGTEIKLLSVEKEYANGELDIRTKGVSVFRVKTFYRQLPGKPYAGGLVEQVPFTDDEDPATKAELKKLLGELYQAMRIQALYIAPPENFKAFDIGHNLGLTLEQEFSLLQMTHESQRQQYLLQHLQRIVPVVQQTERLKERIEQNGHFRHLMPPAF